MKVRWLPVAITHANNCYDFIAQKSERAALKVYKTMTDGAAFLGEHPYAGPFEPLLADQVEAYRSFVVHSAGRIDAVKGVKGVKDRFSCR